MIIIGENINATRKSVSQAIKSRNEDFIAGLAQEQKAAGANFIDVNAGSGYSKQSEKIEAIEWLVDIVQQAVETPLVIDSDEPDVISAALGKYRGEKCLINSVTAEEEKLEVVGKLAVERNAGLIALAMGESGIPDTTEERLKYCSIIMENLVKKGFEPGNIYFDPLVIPVSVDQAQAKVTLDTITEIKRELQGAKTVMGLSNISFGLPGRRLINRTFLSMASWAGLDAAILDPLDVKIMSVAKAADVLTGADKFCRRYSRAHRQGKLDR